VPLEAGGEAFRAWDEAPILVAKIVVAVDA